MQNLNNGPQFKIEANANANGLFYVYMDGVVQHRWTSLEIAQRRVANMQRWFAGKK